MSASHNPGGPKEDWGIKFNYSSGEPAPERITDAIFKFTQSIKELKTADLPDIDLSKIGNNKFGSFEVNAHVLAEHDFASECDCCMPTPRLLLQLSGQCLIMLLKLLLGCDCCMQSLTCCCSFQHSALQCCYCWHQAATAACTPLICCHSFEASLWSCC